MMKHILKTTLLVSSLFLLPLASQAVLADEPVFERGGAAINGYDAVAYHTEDRPVEGNRQYTHEYKGATWLFSSAANRDLFAGDPERYAPAYNGFCAFAMGTYGGTTPTDPNAYTIKDGQLYLNFNRNVGRRFNSDIDAYIAAGENNWQEYAEDSGSSTYSNY